jgi:hypothetical protein
MNGFDQPIRFRRDDDEGSLLVARFRRPRLVEVGQAEQSFSRADRELDPEEPRPVKKGSVLRWLAYALRTASKAIAPSAQ